MHKIIKFFEPLVEYNIKHPFWVLFVSLVIAAIATSFAINLKVDTDIANLLPEDHPNVQALQKLENEVGGETEMKVAIKSPDFEANVEFARKLAEESLELYYPRNGYNFFSHVEFKRNTEVLKDNALYLATESELEDIVEFLQNEIDEAREEANPFFVDFEDEFDDEETAEENGEQGIEQFREAYDNLIPPEYPVSEDSTLVILTLYPTGPQSDLTYLEDLFEEYDELISSLDPKSYHPEMEVRYGGRLKRHLSEFESIMNDVFNSFSTGISSVLILVMLYFWIKKYINYRRGSAEERHHSFWDQIIRMPVPILVIGIPLLISLTWTFGITYLYLGVLNTMTSVLFVILFGLGIDYGIHYYARYIELRSSGLSVDKSVCEAYMKTGTAIFVSALTTASALFVLMFADFRGFSEFGFIAGLGIVLALLCMLFILPALLVIFDRWNWILLIKRSEDFEFGETKNRFPYSRVLVSASIIITVVALAFAGNLRFEYQFSKLEPVFEEYEEFKDFTAGVDEDSRNNPAYIIADNNDELFELVEILREKKENNPDTMIEEVEALQERFPPNQEMANRKLEYIAEIRELLQNSFLVNQDNETLDILRRGSQTTEPLDENRIPDFLKNRFINREGEIGKFVIVYPNRSLSDGRNSIAFKNEISGIELDNDKTYHAASTSIVAASMLELMRNESPYMVAATLVIVFLFILFSFGNLKWSLIALIPLLIGLTWLFGIMLIFGLKFNFYNLVVLPAILGIGCDNGIHLAHRFRDEGKKNMSQVLRSTGQHISMGSLTTMMGFAGLLFTTHPGLQSIGIMAVIGIGMTLFTALTVLPSLVQFMEDRNWLFYD